LCERKGLMSVIPKTSVCFRELAFEFIIIVIIWKGLYSKLNLAKFFEARNVARQQLEKCKVVKHFYTCKNVTASCPWRKFHRIVVRPQTYKMMSRFPLPLPKPYTPTTMRITIKHKRRRPRTYRF
jgi:hypothetical protein